MSPLKKFWYLVWVLFLTGCASAPEIVPGRGAIYGVVSADSHKAIVEKAASGVDTEYSTEEGTVLYTKEMVNYPNLKELYVCLIDGNHSGGKEHLLAVDDTGMSLRSLAIAKGDRLRIRNNTSQTLTFFVSDVEETGEGFQAFPPLNPGTEGVFAITLEGDLELSSEEDERLIISILSRKGLIGLRRRSGDRYVFERLVPGTYDMLFWFWRLGHIQHRVEVKAKTNLRLNETLSVDRIIH